MQNVRKCAYNKYMEQNAIIELAGFARAAEMAVESAYVATSALARLLGTSAAIELRELMDQAYAVVGGMVIEAQKRDSDLRKAEIEALKKVTGD